MNDKNQFTKLKFILVSILVNLSIPLAKGQSYPVPAMKIDVRFLTKNKPEYSVKSFSISNLITIKEFNDYLISVKKDSTAAFYATQIPTSRDINKELVQEILNDKELQNHAMPGVSWSVARNYCVWLSAKSKIDGYDFKYDLPLLSELVAYNQFYKLDTQNELESWALNAYDEAFFELFNSKENAPFDKEYLYDAKKDDTPTMKRKAIYGGSYHMNYIPNSTLNYLQYEYQDSSSRYIGFRIVRKLKDADSVTFLENNCDVTVNFKNNKFNGRYQEKYKNGNYKVLGEFDKGQRVGVWSIWDTNGVLKIQRNYSNNKSFEFLYPVTNNPYKKVYEKYPPYVLQKNANQIYPYLYVEEKSISYTMRLWRELNNVNEPGLFKQIDFALLVKELLKNDSIWYLYGNRADFRKKITGDSLSQLISESPSWDYNRIEIKEDFFFNSDNLLADTRQIGMSFYKNKTDSEPSYIVYFPAIRKDLAKFKITEGVTKEVTNLDDLFFFHEYRGKIIYYSSLHPNNKIDLDIEIINLTKEHDLWLSYGR